MAIPKVIFTLMLAIALFSSACERTPRERRLPVPDLRGGGPVLELEANAPLDPRVISLDPEGLTGTDRICDVSFAGEAAFGSGAHPLPEGIHERRLVRCYAATGEGDLDLLISEAHAASGKPLVPKNRIKIRLLSHDRGFEGGPLAELLAVTGESPLDPPPPAELAVMAARDEFGDRDRLGTGDTGRCAIAWVGRFSPIPAAERARRPPGARYRVPLACRHELGEDEVELVFSERRAPAALGLRRGRIVDLRVLAREGGASPRTVTVFALRDSSE